jgi:hypothetical protein
LAPRLALRGQIGFYLWVLPLGVIILIAGIALLGRELTIGILLCILAAFFLVPAFAGIYLAIVPAYVIDKNGLTVRGIGLVPWTEVNRVELVTVRSFTLIGITVTNSTALEQRKSRWYKLLSRSKTWPRRDLYLPLFLVSAPPQRILETIGQYKEVAPNPTIERDAR